MEFFNCIPLGEAQQRIINSLNGIAVDSEEVFIGDALGRVLAEPVVAKENLPPFNRSTVDGFAVRSADTFGAAEAAPALLSIVGEVCMGKQTAMTLQPGQAIAIPTGGMLPDGADAVIMLEYTERPEKATLLLLKTVAPGENVVARGEDIAEGACILAQGVKIGPSHIGALAACGFPRITVRQRPKVAIISTGDELVDITDKPQLGQIRDVNSYAIAAMLQDWGCQVARLGIIRDSYEVFYETLSQAAAEYQLVVISGGSSVGARDYTVRAIEALGEPGILFHGLAVKPGKPTIFGMSGRVPVFGLPGHPVAAMTVAGQLVNTAVRCLMGQSPAAFGGIQVQARLLRNVPSAPGRDDFVNVRLTKMQGTYQADPILGKSGLIRTIAEADGILHIPGEKTGCYNGDSVQVALIRNTD